MAAVGGHDMGGVTLDNDGAFESSSGEILRYVPCIAAGVSARESWLGVGAIAFFMDLILDDQTDIVRDIPYTCI